MITKKYNLINNVTGWIVFVIALVTYWLTLEPTASYWDCGEFIIQADKLEVGHPPGNPIFMLTARFFANFAPDAASVSVMVNAMSGLLSALTILMLFWTITHLVRRLVVKRDCTEELSLSKYLVIIGSGVVGALAYTWSDTFWFSAVEGEVYAFSSFCTALVFWLILKWENRADLPDSDRYLILIAYVVGVSIAVHLLNLLCIPAIVLVFAYRKWNDMNLVKSLIALLVSFVIVALVLFGLVPGFIKMAQQFELFFVNTIGMNFNSGALIYAAVMTLLFVATLFEIHRGQSPKMIKSLSLLTLLVSGIFFMGHGWWFGWIVWAAVAGFFFSPYFKLLSFRALNVIMWSIAVIFVGYSSYALILIRSSADTPMNQNSPDNVFDLASYLNREQYGDTPLLYGETLYSGQQKQLVSELQDTVMVNADMDPLIVNYPQYESIIDKGAPIYAKGVKGAVPVSEYGFLTEGEKKRNEALAARGGDYYVLRDYKSDLRLNPELNMFFPRIYSQMHRNYYNSWVTLDTVPSNLKELYAVDKNTGENVPELDLQAEPYQTPSGMITYPQKMGYRPTYSQNLAYFFNYQLIHMYMRYFMWNFVGRQNDVLNQQGELDAGNWISGIPLIDNARLGDQSLLPKDLGAENPGHNVFFFLPLILGLIGLIWQAYSGETGIKQFWVVFFLFFMTGIAIVLYLNQPPMQPRERDYAYAGSFYAFAIWIGMGVAALWRSIIYLIEKKFKSERIPLYAAIAAVTLGVIVPIQMVSQTWDDHDRSRRYVARDYAINYLESLEPNAIVFCNGDNDTFPLWYAQEVEGVRPDVKIVNLSYLASDWYANQMRQTTYTAQPIHFTARPQDYAYGNLDVVLPGTSNSEADLLQSLKYLYQGGGRDNDYGYPMMPSSTVSIPIDKKKVIERGLVAPQDTSLIVPKIVINLADADAVKSKGYISLSELLMLDIIATNAAEGWPRPIYWCMTVGTEYHVNLTPYLRGVGMVHQLVPTYQDNMPARTDRAYDVVTKKYLWGGADDPNPPYFDETARRMLSSTRMSVLDVCSELIYEGRLAKEANDSARMTQKYKQALGVAQLLENKLGERIWPYGYSTTLTLAEVYGRIGEGLNDAKIKAKACALIEKTMPRMIEYLVYNREVVTKFGNVALTIESRMMPYQFYRLVEIYQSYGGNPAKIEAMLKTKGFTIEALKKQYDALYNPSDVAEEESVSAESMLSELADVAALVNDLAKMSPEEYAKQSGDNLYLDSIYWEAYNQYVQIIGKEMVDQDPVIGKVDMARSKRLYEEYLKNHP